MKNIHKIVFIGLGLFAGAILFISEGTTFATSPFNVVLGGSGTSSIPVNQILTGNGTSAFNSNTATGTSPYGINVLSGCVAVNGTCVGTGGGTGSVTSIATTWPISGGTITTTGTLSWVGLATSSNLVAGHVVYSTGVNTIADVATTTLSGSGVISVTAGAVTFGASPITVSCSTCGTGTFSALGLGFGATNTDYAILATTTSATNGITSALTVTHSGNTFTLTPSQSGTLTVAGGGTGAATLTGCLTGNGTGAITGSGTCNTSAASVTSVTLSTPNSTLSLGGTNPVTTSGTISADLNLAHANTWTALQQFSSNASSSQESVVTKAYFGATATTTIDSVGAITVATLNVNTIPNATTTNVSVSQSLAEQGNSIPAFFYPGFSVGTSTAWTGTTTTISLGVATIKETWSSIQCVTDAGTLNLQFSNAGSLLNMVKASTTIGTQPFTTNASFAAGAARTVTIGTPASSPTYVGCTVKKSYDF